MKKFKLEEVISDNDIEIINKKENTIEKDIVIKIVTDINKLFYNLTQEYSLQNSFIINNAIKNYINNRNISQLYDYLNGNKLETFNNRFKKINSDKINLR